jgi:hypothetical protein
MEVRGGAMLATGTSLFWGLGGDFSGFLSSNRAVSSFISSMIKVLSRWSPDAQEK